MQVLCAVLSLVILVCGMAKTEITWGETPCSLFCGHEMFQINLYGCNPVVLITKQTRLIQCNTT
jgi:hypothetical protein